jgi:ketosteroid isomerase-like protein
VAEIARRVADTSALCGRGTHDKRDVSQSPIMTTTITDLDFKALDPFPGYPRRVDGRNAVAELYRPYGETIVLDRCHDLAVNHDIKTGVVVLEYASEGRVVSTGAPYNNRYISVLTITDRKVTHWRDYLDPVAVFDALGWPSH